MNHSITEPEVRSYLAALEARLAQLPAEQSEEILFGVREHITDALSRGGSSVPEILAALGTPDDVVAGLAESAPPPPRMPYPAAYSSPEVARPRYQSSTLWVVATAILLPFGILLAGVGWLFGAAGLWMGTRWKVWEKVMGTLLFPGGVVGAQILARLITLPQNRDEAASANVLDPFTTGLPLGATVAVIFIPIVVAVYLLIVGLVRGSRQP